MFEHRRFKVAALAIATAIAVPAVGMIATTSAQAGGGEAKYPGEVIAKTLTVRSHATTYGKNVGTVRKGNVLSIACKVDAVPVDGNRRWYALNGGGKVPARWVKNLGKTPEWCGGRWWYQGTTTKKPSVNLRQGPGSNTKLVGKLAYGKTVEIICKVNGQEVAGNPRWYQLEDGRFVAARYVKNLVGDIPPYCNK